MLILVRLFGIVTVVFGLIYLVRPHALKPYLAFWTKGRRVYIGGVLSILIGIIMLLAASRCRLAWFVVLIGICALIKGIPLLAFKRGKLTSYINWWVTRSLTFLRLVALITIAIGALLIYSA